MILHRCTIPKTIFHEKDNSFSIDYEKGYILEQKQFDFDIYVQKRNYKWMVNIGGFLATSYSTLKELKYNVLSDINACINDDRTAVTQIRWALYLLKYLEKNNGYANKDNIYKLRNEFEKDN